MNDQQNVFGLETVHAALEIARARWASVNGYAPDAVSDDLTKARNYLTAEVCAYAGALMVKGALDAGAILTDMGDRMPVKALMRMGEMFSRMRSDQGCDRTTLLALTGALVGSTSRAAVWFSVSRKGDENTSDHVPALETISKLQKVFGRVGITTCATQLSRSFGKNGFCNVLGMGAFHKGKDGAEPQLEVKRSNPFVRALRTYAETKSEATLKLNQGVKGETK